MLFTLDVDGERFAIRRTGEGGTAYDWLSGPNRGYGFASSGTANRPVEEHRESIRVFLAMIDPNTGYIGDDLCGCLPVTAELRVVRCGTDESDTTRASAFVMAIDVLT